jgi:hypothetical protein
MALFDNMPIGDSSPNAAEKRRVARDFTAGLDRRR